MWKCKSRDERKGRRVLIRQTELRAALLQHVTRLYCPEADMLQRDGMRDDDWLWGQRSRSSQRPSTNKRHPFAAFCYLCTFNNFSLAPAPLFPSLSVQMHEHCGIQNKISALTHYLDSPFMTSASNA